jgi:hypothetical protein
MKFGLVAAALVGTVFSEVCDQIPGVEYKGPKIKDVDTPTGSFQECCDTCREYDGCTAFQIWNADKICHMFSSVSGNKTSDQHTSGICHRQPTPAPPPSPPTNPPTPKRPPPPTPAQFTAIMGTTTAPRRVYSDATTKRIAAYTTQATGPDAYEVDWCDIPLIFSNAGAIPGVSPPGKCKAGAPSPYSSPCPSVYAPGWPPTAQDFYGGAGKDMSYNSTVACPVGSSSTGQCDRYVLDVYKDGYEVFDFYINADTQVPIYGTIKVGAVKYVHSLKPGVDPAMLQPPSDCPDPDGPCAPCLTGPCAPCSACVGQPATGQCAPCYAVNPDGTTCIPGCNSCWGG